MKKKARHWIVSVSAVFLFVTVLCIALSAKLQHYAVDVQVVMGANLLLFLSVVLNLFFQQKNLANANPSAMIRGVMIGTFLKLIVLAAAAIIYLSLAGEQRSARAVYAGMALYFIYTWVEVQLSLKMKSQK